MTTTLRPSPRRDVFDLVQSLARAGWGPELSDPSMRSARIILRDLSDTSFDQHTGRSGTVSTTAPQIADRTGYSERWTRQGLYLLEDLGLIEWHRGGIREGNPTASVIRLVKSAIADLVERARAWHDRILEGRAAATRDRIRRTIRLRFCKGKRRTGLLEVHAEVATSLPPYGRRAAGRAPTTPDNSTPSTPPETTMSNPLPEFMPKACTHGKDLPRYCNACRNLAWRAQSDHERREQARELARLDEITADQTPVNWELERYLDATYPGASPARRARYAFEDPKARAIANA